MAAQAHCELSRTTLQVRDRGLLAVPHLRTPNPQLLLQGSASPQSATHKPGVTTLLPHTELELVSPRVSQAQCSDLPAVYQEKFQSLTVFAYERALNNYQQLD